MDASKKIIKTAIVSLAAARPMVLGTPEQIEQIKKLV
jgi:hypothetical protein